MSQDYIHIMQCGIDPVTTKWIPPLTKREQFAMAAMQGMLARGARSYYSGGIGVTFFEDISEKAVEYADALIEELDK